MLTMKLNKDLLPLKVHFFLVSAAVVPVSPHIPSIARQLGFSSINIGWIQSISPIVPIFVKPFIGSIADKYKCQKPIFIMFLILYGFCIYSVKWIQPLPTSSNTTLSCQDGLHLKLCSNLLEEKSLLNKMRHQLLNSSIVCKAEIEFLNSPMLLYNHQNEEEINSTVYLKEENNYLMTNETIFFKLGRVRSAKDGCALVNINSILDSKSHRYLPYCKEGDSANLVLHCQNKVLQKAARTPTVEGYRVLLTSQFWFLLLAVVGYFVGYGVFNSLSDAISFSLLGEKTKNYGNQRLWGSIAWGLSALICGFILDELNEGKLEKDYTFGYNVLLVFMVLDLVFASRLRVEIPHKSQNIRKDVQQLFKSYEVMIFTTWCILCGICFSLKWNYLFWYLEDLASNIKGSDVWIKTLQGLVLTVQCFCGEIPFLFYSGRIMKRIGYNNCMTVVVLAYGMRFIIYSMLTNPWWILPVEPINGVTFALFYTTMTTYASKISPPGTEATVQNVFSSFFEGVGTGVGGLLGGYFISIMGPSKTYFVIGVFAVIFGCLHMIIQRFTSIYTPVAKDEMPEPISYETVIAEKKEDLAITPMNY